MADFNKHIEPLVETEGGYRLVHVPGDRGGRTYAGISEKFNPDWEGWELIDSGAPLGLIIAAVHRRYSSHYWEKIQGDLITDDDVAEILLSSVVLSGPVPSILMAQQAVEATQDGVMGPNTIQAINGCSVDLFEARFTLARINRFRGICNRDRSRSQSAFLLGWLNRVYGELAT